MLGSLKEQEVKFGSYISVCAWVMCVQVKFPSSFLE